MNVVACRRWCVFGVVWNRRCGPHMKREPWNLILLCAKCIPDKFPSRRCVDVRIQAMPMNMDVWELWNVDVVLFDGVHGGQVDCWIYMVWWWRTWCSNGLAWRPSWNNNNTIARAMTMQPEYMIRLIKSVISHIAHTHNTYKHTPIISPTPGVQTYRNSRRATWSASNYMLMLADLLFKYTFLSFHHHGCNRHVALVQKSIVVTPSAAQINDVSMREEYQTTRWFFVVFVVLVGPVVWHRTIWLTCRHEVVRRSRVLQSRLVWWMDGHFCRVYKVR